MEKVEGKHRDWYLRQILSNGWIRSVLLAMIQSEAHRRQGAALTNFDRLLPAPQSDLVRQTFKGDYSRRKQNHRRPAEPLDEQLGSGPVHGTRTDLPPRLNFLDHRDRTPVLLTDNACLRES